MGKLTDKQIKIENSLFRKLPETCRVFQLGNYDVRIIDIHIHLPNFKSSPSHMHSYFEAHVIFNGKGEITSQKRSRVFETGELLLTSPNFEHSWRTTCDDLYMYVVSFELKSRNDQPDNPAPIDLVMSKLFEIEDFICPCRGIKPMLKNIVKEMSTSRPGLNYMLACYTMELIISFARHVNAYREKLNEELPEDQSDTDDPVVILVNKYLADNYTNDISLDMVARFVCKSKRSITRHYKKATGTTIIDKLLQMRIFLAEHLLAGSDKSIKMIAYEVGMSDVSYFCRQFKKLLGCSPSIYRKQNPQKSNINVDDKGDLIKRFDALKP